MNRYPRVTIEFCTQCRWMLRAAYFGQELLSTFSTALGEVALQPATGGRFVVTVSTSSEEVVIWDRKEKGGFPETKVLKQLVRDIIEPDKGLGHSDRKGHKTKNTEKSEGTTPTRPKDVGKQDSQIEESQAVETGQAIDTDCQDCR